MCYDTWFSDLEVCIEVLKGYKCLQYREIVEADEVGALRIVLYEAKHSCMLQTPAGGSVRQGDEQLNHC